MSNRRVKSLGYDDDDFYDDEEEDYENEEQELSPEDKEQMRLGTVQVRTALGPSFPATDHEIQEALWHYYYDVGKSVTYLKNQHKPASATPKKQSQTKNIASYKDCSTPCSAKDFFKDCPWMQIPKERRGEIIIEPLYPRLGLLGGSSKDGKMSKLAALAAKRRQKENQQSSSSISDSTLSSRDDYTSGLNRLKITRPSTKPDKSTEKRTQSELSAVEKTPPVDKNHLQIQSKEEGVQKNKLGENQEQEVDVIPKDINLRARPSAFASVMTHNNHSTSLTKPLTFSNEDLVAKTFDFTEPSPDDVVTKAQHSKAPGANKQTQKDTSKGKADLSSNINNLSIQESTKPKSKNIDVVTEYKKTKRKNAANFVVIGHVDAGKSTLMGRLLFDLKAIDQRTIDKYKKEADRIGKGSFAFAWVMDQGTEERERGVTIDIATNRFDTDLTSFTILDAPGHRDFVPNMIAGASQADFAVLVIDASIGNFESGLKGQTKEHALLVRSIGVQRVIVAVNKMDSVDWSKERFEEIQQQMSGFLTSAGFQAKNIAFVPCSGLEGANILRKVSDPAASWYAGNTLVEELDKSEPTTFAVDKPLRLTISDVFRGGVQNPLSISGRIEAGNVQVSEQIVVMPSGERAYIKGLEVDDEPLDWAVAGQNVVLHLTDIDAMYLKTGDVLCSTNSSIVNISEFRAKVLAFDHLTPMNIDVHRGRLHVPGRISQLVATLDKATGSITKKKPKIVTPGNVVRVVVQLEQPVPLEAPSRVVLRANGETIAAGLIE